VVLPPFFGLSIWLHEKNTAERKMRAIKILIALFLMNKR